MKIGDRIGKLTVVEKRFIGKGFRVFFICDCGERVSDSLSQVKKGKRKTCGQCSRKLGRYRDKDGYIVVRDAGKAIFEHRLVMQRHLGRRLRNDECVHHRNRVRHDNRIENLEVVGRAGHTKKHWENLFELERIVKTSPAIMAMLKTAGWVWV